jgi:hypothetical protein
MNSGCTAASTADAPQINVNSVVKASKNVQKFWKAAAPLDLQTAGVAGGVADGTGLGNPVKLAAVAEPEFELDESIEPEFELDEAMELADDEDRADDV